MILTLFISTVTGSIFFLMNMQLAPLVAMIDDLSTSSDVRAESFASRPAPTATMTELTLDMVVSLQLTVTPMPSVVQTSPTPSPTPISSMTKANSGIINSDLVNVRSYPSLAGEVLGQAKQGERLEILAISNDGLWVRVCCPLGSSEEASQSWIATQFIARNPDLP